MKASGLSLPTPPDPGEEATRIVEANKFVVGTNVENFYRSGSEGRASLLNIVQIKTFRQCAGQFQRLSAFRIFLGQFFQHISCHFVSS
jgi:hypothetical protein